jgi:GT2 family glycosyltransferase
MSRKRNNNKSLLDICMLTAGRDDMFSKCVDALLPELKPEYRLFVFNNGHPSQTYNEIYRKIPDAFVKSSNNMSGFSDGANTSIRMGTSPLCLFITDDIFLHEGTIETLIRRMDEPDIALCGLKLLFPEDSPDPGRPAGKVQHVGHGINVNGEVTHPLIGWNPDNPKCNISRNVASVTGGVFMVRRHVFQKAGGFNPIYGRGYYEDTDLCLTIRAMGYRIFIDTEATATHCVGASYGLHKPPDLNLMQNQMVFRLRQAHNLSYDEWMFY